MKIILQGLLPYFLLFSLLIGKVSLYAQPKADFIIQSNKGCVPVTAKFTATATGNIVSYFWTFGNGNNSVVQNPSAIYITPGKYTVKLVVTDNLGRKDSITRTNIVEVYGNPIADFKEATNKVCEEENVSFSDKSTKADGNLLSWKWDFGDGTTSTAQNPTIKYKTAGKYDVTLIVKDANGCENIVSKKLLMEVKPLPKVDFSVDYPFSCVTPHKVQFSNNSSKGNGYKYLWDFGNGDTSSQLEPSYTYTKAGKYSVKLKVISEFGCVKELLIKDMVHISSIKANFDSDLKSACDNGIVKFFNLTTPNISGMTWEWHFGDGSKSTEYAPIHIYNKIGAYTVKLIVKYLGCSDSIIKKDFIAIHKAPNANFYADDSLLCKLPAFVTFTPVDSDPENTYTWDFGNGKSNTRVFTKEGKYSIKLTVKNKNGCESTMEKNGYIDVSLIQLEVEHKDRGCIPLEVNFIDICLSPFPIVKYTWDLGNGTISNEKSPTTTYTEKGKYKIKLVVENSKGCKDSVYSNLKVGTKVPPEFSASPLKVCSNDTVYFKNLTKDSAYTDMEYKWTFDPDVIDPLRNQHFKERNPYFLLRGPKGLVDVSLISIHLGCEDTITKRDYIQLMGPYSDIEAKYDPCLLDSISLYNNSKDYNKHIWTFWDSKKSNVLHPKYKFGEGIFINRLEVWDTITGCYDYDTSFIITEKIPVADIEPKGPFCAPATVKLNDKSANYTKISWFINDKLLTANEKTNGVLISNPGVHYAKVVVQNNIGCKREQIDTFYVSGPKIRVSAENLIGCIPLTVTLTDSNYFPGKIAYWKIEDEQNLNISSKTTTYTFKKPLKAGDSTYYIEFHESDSNKCQSFKTFHAKPKGPLAELSVVENKLCDMVQHNFSITVLNREPFMNYTFHTDLGDSVTTSNKIFFMHQYSKPGTYNVAVTVTDQNGCKYELVRKIIVEEPQLKPGFTADTTGAFCPPLSVHFTDTSSFKYNRIVKWEWDFGDGTKSNLQHPGKIYYLPGTYGVRLTVTDNLGCAKSIYKPDFILIKGPIGEYSFDKKNGCIPLTVNFTSKTERADKIEWDFGDGVVKQGNNHTHTYPYAGTFIPLLILSDSFGCTYVMPPIDTIRTFALPLADFNHSGYCKGLPINFYNTSQPGQSAITKCSWDFGDGNSTDGFTVSHIFAQSGVYPIRLKVVNDKGCESDTTIPITIFEVKPDFTILKNHYCLGENIKLSDKSESGAPIIKWVWYFGDLTKDTTKTPNKVFSKKGMYDIKLVATNQYGCTDSLIKPQFVLVGDTTNPGNNFIYRVSVVNDNEVDIKHSAFRDIDFGKYHYYLEQNNSFNKIATSYNKSDTLFSVKGLNTLKQSYCFKVTQENICGFESDITSAPTHCTVESRAYGDTNVAIVTWSPYIGWNRVKSYNIFRENPNNINEFNYLATVSGDSFQYLDYEIVCYKNHRYRIQAIEENGFLEYSWSDTCAALPIYSNTVLPNEIWRATVEENKYVKVEWTQAPTNRFPIAFYHLYTSSNGLQYKLLQTYPADSFSAIDKKVWVNTNSYYYKMQVEDVCKDRSSFNNIGKTILLTTTINSEFRPVLTWSKYKDWTENVAYYEVQIKKPDGSFETIGQTSASDTTFTDNITPFNCVPEYTYRVIGYRNQPITYPDSTHFVFSVSNESTAAVPSKLFVPNAFSPNADGYNEVFLPKGIFIKQFNMKIYNRWGEKLFEHDGCIDGWNGMYKNQAVPEGVYLCIIEAIGSDNKPYFIKTDVTVLR